MSSEQILDVSAVHARIETYDWVFSSERRAEIDAHWQKTVTEKPKMFNGRVLLQHEGYARDSIFHARYFETDYADFLAWHHFNHPPPAMRNGFAMAALQTRDGAFLLGEMAQHTINAGKIYFAAGTPDRNDVLADGTVDLAGSAERELREETGLQPDEFHVGAGWSIVLSGVRVAFMRPVIIDLPAVEARKLILSRLALQQEPELSDIVIVRNAAECDQPRMPHFMQYFLKHAFAKA